MTLLRRQFLQYTAGSALGTVALGWLTGCSTASDAPGGAPTANASGAIATDADGMPYELSALLSTATAGDRPLAEGLDAPAFLVITDGPDLADYGISAVCPHRQCIVNWDAAAQTFICPCHNSQFDGDGELIQGPATTGLSRITVTPSGEDILLSPA